MSTGPDPAVAAWRKAERARLLASRDALPLAQRRTLDAQVTSLLLEGFGALAGRMVGFYWPMKGEFDPRVFVHRLRERGARGALPVVVAQRQPLEFREWWPGIPTTPGVYDLPEPPPPAVAPDAVLMPPVGFDAAGYRLGYGGGYFDRTLAASDPQPVKIGVARALSRIETIRPQPHDIPMDFVVTEDGIHRVASGRLVPATPAEAADTLRELLARRG